MEQTMKAIVFEEFGGLEKLKLATLSIPHPTDNEVLIEVVYTSVNPVDWKIREGFFKNRMPYEFPIIPGWDVSGNVMAVGKNVKQFKVGDAIFAYCRKPTIKWGTYAEFVCVDVNYVALKPKILTYAEAAAIPLTALTAWQALFEKGQLKKGDRVLIQAGAGGVGGFAVQFAKYAGAFVYATASQSNHAYVSKLGADVVLDYHQSDMLKKIHEAEPKGFDLVLDCVGGETLKASMDLVKKGGSIVSIVDQVDLSSAISKGIHAEWVFVHPDGQQLHQIAELINTGKIVAPQIEIMRLDEAAKAQEKIREGHTRGKIVLKVKNQ